MLWKAFCSSSWGVKTKKARDSVGTLRNVNRLVFPSFISCQSTPSPQGDCLVTPGCPKGLRALHEMHQNPGGSQEFDDSVTRTMHQTHAELC